MVDPRTLASQPNLRVGPWTLDFAARTISGPSGTRRVEPKPMAIMAFLATRAGEVVSRQELLEIAWPGEMATDDVLSRSISELRRALGDDSKNPSSLVTIRGIGYQLVVPRVESNAIATGASVPTVRGFPRAAVAVGFGLVGLLALTWTLVGRRPTRVDDDPHLLPLSSEPGEDMNPRISPDGSRILSVRRDSTGALSIMVRLVDGSGQTRVGSTAARSAAWSPDGTRIAFVSEDERGRVIATMGSLGGPATIVARLSEGVVLGLDWSPDGESIVFAAHDAPFDPFRLVRANVRSLRVDTLTNGGATAVGDAFPTYAPDGQTIAFARFTTETDADVYVIATAARTVSRRTFDARNITGIAFAQRGDSILFASDRDGSSAVWEVSLHGGPITRVVGSDARIGGLSASRTTGAITVAATQVTQQLRMVRPNASTSGAVVAATTRSDGLPSISPDGKRVAFVSDRSGEKEVWLASIHGDSLVPLTAGGGFASVPSWSPDGSKLVVGRHARGVNEIWTIDVAQRRSNRVPISLRTPILPSWASDGQSIILASMESGEWNLWRAPISGAPRRLTAHGALRGVELPDGRILFTKSTAAGIWTRLPSGADSLVEPHVLMGDWTNWCATEKGLVYVNRDARGRQQVVRYDAKRGASVVIDSVQVPIGDGGISATRDGALIVYGSVDRRSGNLYRLASGRSR